MQSSPLTPRWYHPADLRQAFTILAVLGLVACSGAVPEPPQAPAPPPSPAVEVAPAAPASAPDPRPIPDTTGPITVDLHVDTITMMINQGVPWTSSKLEASLPALQAGGVNVVVQAAWIERGVEDPRGMALGKIRRIRSMVEQSHGAAAIVTGPEQLERVTAEGRIAVILAVEGGTALIDGEATLRELHALGVRMIGLTWSESSPYADSSAEPRAGAAGGLTPEGKAMVALCNDLGILIDVSHMSDRATEDVLALSRAPVLASHSNARAVRDVPRNLSDALLAGIAARGGLIGAMFHGPFVADSEEITRADAVAMILALVERVGADAVGIGTDFDGIIAAPVGLAGARDLPRLYEDLRAAGLGPGALEKVRGGSFVRFWKAADSARTRP